MNDVVVVPVIQKALGRLVSAFDPEKVILFGSFARGNPHTGSDVDLLVIVRPGEDNGLLLRRARQLVVDCFPRVDVILCNTEELDNTSSDRNSFFSSIIESGLVVYRHADINL